LQAEHRIRNPEHPSLLEKHRIRRSTRVQLRLIDKQLIQQHREQRACTKPAHSRWRLARNMDWVLEHIRAADAEACQRKQD